MFGPLRDLPPAPRPARRRGRATVVVDVLAVVARLLRDHSIPLALLVAVAMVSVAVMRVDRALGLASSHHLHGEATAAALAADEAVLQLARDPRRDGRDLATSWGATVQLEPGPGETFRLLVPSGSDTYVFPGEWLAGAAPACFAQPLTIGAAVDVRAALAWLPQAACVRLGPQPVPSLPAESLPRLPECEPDAEIAFMHMRAGTDRADWVWGNGADTWLMRAAADVVEVPGNLWLRPAAAPLRVHLARPLTVVVRGNIYLGRGLEVTGAGPLTLVALRQGATFRDLDGDGVRGAAEPLLPGAGPLQLEGDGNVYLGLPGAPQRAPLRVAAQLVASGEVHLLTDTTMRAALVSAHAVTRCHDAARLELPSLPLLDVERCRVPGFAVSGGPRPAHLRPGFVVAR